MKRIMFFSLALMVIFGFSAMLFAQEQKAGTLKEPAKNPPRSVSTQKVNSGKKHLKMSAGEITEVQNALINAGYLKEKASGTMDQSTKQALEEYQKANNLKVTGAPDKATRDKLGIKHSAPAKLKKSPIKKPQVKPEKKN